MLWNVSSRSLPACHFLSLGFWSVSVMAVVGTIKYFFLSQMDPDIWLLNTTHRPPALSCIRCTLHMYGLGVLSCPVILVSLGIIATVCKR